MFRLRFSSREALYEVRVLSEETRALVRGYGGRLGRDLVCVLAGVLATARRWWGTLMQPDYVNRSQLLRRGWTPALITMLLQKPDRVESRQRGFKRWEEHRYELLRVAAAELDERWILQQVAKWKRAESAEKRRLDVRSKYESWREALPEVAACMFSLNRYAKYRTCSALHRVEIYRLKNDLIELLYSSGYCIRAFRHVQELAEQKCRDCDGADSWCNRCDGSGVYRSAKTLRFWCFVFLIQGKQYTWHQPEHDVQFQPREEVPPQDWDGGGSVKPLMMSSRHFAAGKELIRWVLDRAAGESANEAPGAISESGTQQPLVTN